MNHSELIRLLAETFDRLKIRYYITGSTASAIYAEPRFTYDVDVVAAITSAQIKAFCSSFPPDQFYVSEDAARDAVTSGGQFNIIHSTSGLKADIIIATNELYDRIRLVRARRLRPAPDYEVCVAAPEDLIIKKLEFYKLGESEKHIRDVRGILKSQAASIDWDYIADWAGRRGILDVWRPIAKDFGK